MFFLKNDPSHFFFLKMTFRNFFFKMTFRIFLFFLLKMTVRIFWPFVKRHIPGRKHASMHDVLLVIADMKLRGTTAADGRKVWSAIDFIQRAAHKTHEAAAQAFRRWTRAGSQHCVFFKQNMAMMHLRRSNNSGYATPGLDIDGLKHLLNLMDSEVTVEFHDACRNAFLRVRAGDTTLIEEIVGDTAYSCPREDMRDGMEEEDGNTLSQQLGERLSQQAVLQGADDLLGKPRADLANELADVQVAKAKASAQLELNVQAHLASFEVKLKEKNITAAAENMALKLANEKLALENERLHIEDRAALEARKLDIQLSEFKEYSAFELQTKQKVLAETSAIDLAQKKINKKEWAALQLRLAEDAQMQSRAANLEKLLALECKRIESNATLIQQEQTRIALNESMIEQEKRWRAMQAQDKSSTRVPS